MKKYIEIIALIYKSLDYLEFISEQFKSSLCKVNGWDVSTRIIANNATEEILDALPKCGVNFSIYNDKNPNEYYINRVYRCHNFGALTTSYPNICFINSDILMSHGWLKNLLKYHDGINIPCSRSVESGKMFTDPNRHGISMNFGLHPKYIDYAEWAKFAESIKESRIEPGGLLGPVIFETQRFIDAGLYPEGNLYADGIGTCNGDVIKPGDVHFFEDILAPKFGMKHITVFDSICYHIQVGEQDG